MLLIKKNEALIGAQIRITAVLWIWVRIRIDFDRLDPSPDPGGQKRPTKRKTMKKLNDLSATLHVLTWGLGASSVAWMSFMEA